MAVIQRIVFRENTLHKRPQISFTSQDIARKQYKITHTCRNYKYTKSRRLIKHWMAAIQPAASEKQASRTAVKKTFEFQPIIQKKSCETCRTRRPCIA